MRSGYEAKIDVGADVVAGYSSSIACTEAFSRPQQAAGDSGQVVAMTTTTNGRLRP